MTDVDLLNKIRKKIVKFGICIYIYIYIYIGQTWAQVPTL